MGVACTTHGVVRNTCKILIGKLKEETALETES
jgi:hypothetical protein